MDNYNKTELSKLEININEFKEFFDESQIKNPETPKSKADNKFFEEFEAKAHSLGVVEIGYTRVDPEISSIMNISYPHAIILTFKMDKELIKTPSGEKAKQLNDELFIKLGKITFEISDFLRSRGYATQAVHSYGNVTELAKLGQQAGLGCIGNSGLLITPQLGPQLKISAIFTSIDNLPEKTGTDHSWVADYCDRCSKCVRACPENAMTQKTDSNGKRETEFHPELCINSTKGCTVCIEECVFYRRGYEEIKRISDKLKARLANKK